MHLSRGKPADIAAQNIVAVSRDHESSNGTFHVTADNYYNMMDVCDCITRCYGYQMRECSLEELVEHVNKNCSREDPLFPLVPFINRNFNRLSDMSEKRYATANFQSAVRRAPGTRSSPPLDDTMRLVIDYLRETDMI